MGATVLSAFDLLFERESMTFFGNTEENGGRWAETWYVRNDEYCCIEFKSAYHPLYNDVVFGDSRIEEHIMLCS